MTEHTAESAFTSLSLPQPQLDNLKSLGYQRMTPVQARSLPIILEGRDLIARAKTGSGKTAAFGIALAENLNPRFFAPQALVLCPTRELSTQVAQELRRLVRYRNNIKVLTLCGGQPIGPQIGSLAHGAHVIVGTPGRIADHLRKKTLELTHVRTLVLDEADRMLDMGFIDAIEGIIAHTPAERQTLLFSATYPDRIRQLSEQFQRTPAEVSVEAVHNHQQIRQYFCQVDKTEKLETLALLLSHYRPASTVVFCNTRQRCAEVTDFLRLQGYHALALHGDMDQKDRDQVLVRFASGSSSVLVATDVAARGLDIEELAAVVNYELSRQPEVYVHRIGRTGRAGREGLAVSLYSESEQYKLDMISDYLQQPLTGLERDSLQYSELAITPPPMVSLCINGGKKQKIRAGDILGALTGEAGIPADQIGKISIFDYQAYVAISRGSANKALGRLLNGKIKGRKFRVRRL